LEDVYDKEYSELYLNKMCKKLGLFKHLGSSVDDILSDQAIIALFFNAMEKTGADFTNSFRFLNVSSLPGLDKFDESLAKLKTELMNQTSTVEELIKAHSSSMNSNQVQTILMLMETNPNLLERLGLGRAQLEGLLGKLEKVNALKEMTPEVKLRADDETWSKWIDAYAKRLRHDTKDIAANELYSLNEERIRLMNANNPRFVLRNYMAQIVIDSAEQGDYSDVWKLFKMLERPFDETLDGKTLACETGTDEGDCDRMIKKFQGRPPKSTCDLRVSCSS
jgi:uncharacterized protein YdiU (UPF0061 family)